MSEHKWNIENGERIDYMFNRRMMNSFEGSHLGMHRRWTHKSGPCSTHRWRSGHLPKVQRKYVIGLLNKYVGKPLDSFIKAFNHKVKESIGVDIDKDSWMLYLDRGDFKKLGHSYQVWQENFIYEPYGKKRPFYVDEEGIIRHEKIDPSHTNRKGLSKMQVKYNQSLFIPKVKDVKLKPYGSTSLYSAELEMNKPEYRKPFYFFDAFVSFNGTVKKVPLYGSHLCLYKDYASYVRYPFGKQTFYGKDWMTSQTRDKAAIGIEETWVPIDKSMIPGIKSVQHWHVMIPNEAKDVALGQAAICTDPIERKRLAKKASAMPEMISADLGMGEIAYFMKRTDYESVTKSIQ